MRRNSQAPSPAVLLWSDFYTLDPDNKAHNFWGHVSSIPLLLFGISQALHVSIVMTIQSKTNNSVFSKRIILLYLLFGRPHIFLFTIWRYNIPV